MSRTQLRLSCIHFNSSKWPTENRSCNLERSEKPRRSSRSADPGVPTCYKKKQNYTSIVIKNQRIDDGIPTKKDTALLILVARLKYQFFALIVVLIGSTPIRVSSANDSLHSRFLSALKKNRLTLLREIKLFYRFTNLRQLTQVVGDFLGRPNNTGRWFDRCDELLKIGLKGSGLFLVIKQHQHLEQWCYVFYKPSHISNMKSRVIVDVKQWTSSVLLAIKYS